MTDTEQNLGTNIKCATYCHFPREIIFIASAIGITIGLSWSLYLVLSWINQMLWYERYCSLPSRVSKLHSLTKVTVESPMLPQFYQKTYPPPPSPKPRRHKCEEKPKSKTPKYITYSYWSETCSQIHTNSTNAKVKRMEISNENMCYQK